MFVFVKCRLSVVAHYSAIIQWITLFENLAFHYAPAFIFVRCVVRQKNQSDEAIRSAVLFVKHQKRRITL